MKCLKQNHYSLSVTKRAVKRALPTCKRTGDDPHRLSGSKRRRVEPHATCGVHPLAKRFNDIYCQRQRPLARTDNADHATCVRCCAQLRCRRKKGKEVAWEQRFQGAFSGAPTIGFGSSQWKERLKTQPPKGGFCNLLAGDSRLDSKPLGFRHRIGRHGLSFSSDFWEVVSVSASSPGKKFGRRPSRIFRDAHVRSRLRERCVLVAAIA